MLTFRSTLAFSSRVSTPFSKLLTAVESSVSLWLPNAMQRSERSYFSEPTISVTWKSVSTSLSLRFSSKLSKNMSISPLINTRWSKMRCGTLYSSERVKFHLSTSSRYSSEKHVPLPTWLIIIFLHQTPNFLHLSHE